METADGTYEAELLGFEVPSTVCVGVAEGKHRMVRRMLANAGTLVFCVFGFGGVETRPDMGRADEAVVLFDGRRQQESKHIHESNYTGHGVLTLHRVRYGEVDLGALPEGEIREIAPGSPEGAWAQRLLAAGRPNGEGSGDGTRPPREPREESTG